MSKENEKEAAIAPGWQNDDSRDMFSSDPEDVDIGDTGTKNPEPRVTRSESRDMFYSSSEESPQPVSENGLDYDRLADMF